VKDRFGWNPQQRLELRARARWKKQEKQKALMMAAVMDENAVYLGSDFGKPRRGRA
jgi:hypothetical protein